MDQELKEFLEKMEDRIVSKTEDKILTKIDDRFTEMMSFLAETVATKEDLKAFATKEDLKAFATKEDLQNVETSLEKKMEDGFSSIRSELKWIKEKLIELEERIARLEKRTNEDTRAVAIDVITLRKELDMLKKAMKDHGIKIPSA